MVEVGSQSAVTAGAPGGQGVNLVHRDRGSRRQEAGGKERSEGSLEDRSGTSGEEGKREGKEEWGGREGGRTMTGRRASSRRGGGGGGEEEVK